MPRKTIWVSEADEVVWSRAESLPPHNMSKLIAELLRKEVSRMEAIAALNDHFREITIEETQQNHSVKKKMFIGKWIAQEFNPDSHWSDQVAITRKGQILVSYQDGGISGYHVYSDLQEFLRDEHKLVLEANKVKAAEALGGEYIEFLDV